MASILENYEKTAKEIIHEVKRQLEKVEDVEAKRDEEQCTAIADEDSELSERVVRVTINEDDIAGIHEATSAADTESVKTDEQPAATEETLFQD